MDKKLTLWFKVEQEIATLLLDRLEHLQITPERASQIAKFVVKAIPSQMTDQQMADIIPKLDDQFLELASIVQTHFEEYERINQSKIESQVEELMKQGHFQEATNLMQNYFIQKI